MKKSSMWLGIFAGTMLLIAMVACCTFIPAATNSSSVYAAEGEVNLEKLTEEFETYAKADTKDLASFETAVNKKEVYTGKGHVSVTTNEKGSVVGYKDDNGEPGYQAADSKVFTLDVEPESEKIVAHDRKNRYYGRRSSGIGTYMLVGYMMGNQRRYYGSPYRSPASARWQKSGYHSRLKTSSSSRSSRSGSSRSTGSRRSSGGFGSGK